jgi:hypothetical protein
MRREITGSHGFIAVPFLILQSFANEDQLTVHKKKHDMMLNLGGNTKNAGFVGKTHPATLQMCACTRIARGC